jgi:putative two-component system response regulator
LVDDSAQQIRLLRRTLVPEGFDCIGVTQSRDALDACLTSKPDVVLLDVEMPGLGGLGLCRALKAAPETCLTPILMMTAHPDRDRHLRALEAGADDFLTKPLVLEALRARVHSAVATKRHIDALDDAAASIVMLGAAIEARDRSTEGHCQRLGDYAARLGRRIGLGAEDVRALEHGGYLHDLGKIAIPDAVLFKPGSLNVEELAVMKTHPLIGDRICAPLRSLARVRPIIRSHHETLDGSGYPDGLRGRAVPLLAQITAIADVYDALTTDRPYRRALAPARASDILLDACAEGKRDRTLVLEFLLELGRNQ